MVDNLGITLKTRYEGMGQRADMEETIAAVRQAVDSTSPGQHDRLYVLNSLATS